MKRLLIALILTACSSNKTPVVEPTPNVSTPTPTPTASPTPTPSPTPPQTGKSVLALVDQEKPLAGKTPQTKASLDLVLARGEVVGWILDVKQVPTNPIAPPQGIKVDLFAMPTVKISKPTAKIFPAGDYYDPLVPEAKLAKGYNWIDITIDRGIMSGSYSFSIGDLPVNIKVLAKAIPEKPSVPLYVGLSPSGLIAGHKLDPNMGLEEMIALTQPYVDMLRAHRIEPYGAWITDPPVKTDGSLDTSKGGMATLTLNGLAGPDMVSHQPKNLAYLKGAAKIPGAWGYMWDEPGPSEFPEMIKYLKLAKQAGLKTMVTTVPTPELRPLIDYFTIPFQEFDPKNTAPNYWLYGACPSHGCDGSGQLNGTPDIMIDQPSIHARVFPIMGYALGGKAVLYYESIYSYYAGKKDPWVDQYAFGGNGDGNLVYPDKTSRKPISSIRLKQLRQGMFDIEYLLGTKQTLIKDAFTWSKAMSDYQNLRK